MRNQEKVEYSSSRPPLDGLTREEHVYFAWRVLERRLLLHQMQDAGQIERETTNALSARTGSASEVLRDRKAIISNDLEGNPTYCLALLAQRLAPFTAQ